MPELEQLLNDLMSTGRMSPALMEAVQAALTDPRKLDEVIEQLKAMGADQIGSGPPLNIEDFYRDGAGKYQLRWPLPSHIPLPVPFSDLDRKTQFFVLFQEWSRREMDGMMALNAGNVDGAEKTFEECVERAKQIDVNELLARSYEDLRRVAQRRGDRAAEREWTDQATRARKG